MQFLGGKDWKLVPQIKPRLRAEDGISARSRPVGLELALLNDQAEQVLKLYPPGSTPDEDKAAFALLFGDEIIGYGSWPWAERAAYLYWGLSLYRLRLASFGTLLVIHS